MKTNLIKPNVESSRLVTSLKKQLKEIKENLKIKEEEMNKYKKNIKFTRIREIQVFIYKNFAFSFKIENQNYHNETLRLKNIIQQIFPNFEIDRFFYISIIMSF